MGGSGVGGGKPFNMARHGGAGPCRPGTASQPRPGTSFGLYAFIIDDIEPSTKSSAQEMNLMIVKPLAKFVLTAFVTGLLVSCVGIGPNQGLAQNQSGMPTPDPSTGLYSLDVYAKRIAYYKQTGSDPKELAYSEETYDLLKHKQDALANNDPNQAAMWQEKAIALKNEYDAETTRDIAQFNATHPNPLPYTGPSDPCVGLGQNLPQCQAPPPPGQSCQAMSADGQTVICN